MPLEPHRSEACRSCQPMHVLSFGEGRRLLCLVCNIMIHCVAHWRARVPGGDTSKLCTMDADVHGNFGLPLRLGYPLSRALGARHTHTYAHTRMHVSSRHMCTLPTGTQGARARPPPFPAEDKSARGPRSYASPRFSFPHVSGFTLCSELEVYQPMSCDHEDTWRLRGSKLQSLRWRFDKFWEW